MAVVALLFGAPIFGTLYPLAAVSALVAGFATYGVLAAKATNLGADGRLPFTLLVAAIVFWTVSRLDHRLAARVAPYRVIRHVVRIVVIAVFLSVTSLNAFATGAWPRSIGQLGVLAGDRRLLLLLAVFAVGAHLLLTRATGVRMRWRTLLEIVRLRPSGLDRS